MTQNLVNKINNMTEEELADYSVEELMSMMEELENESNNVQLDIKQFIKSSPDELKKMRDTYKSETLSIIKEQFPPELQKEEFLNDIRIIIDENTSNFFNIVLNTPDNPTHIDLKFKQIAELRLDIDTGSKMMEALKKHFSGDIAKATINSINTSIETTRSQLKKLELSYTKLHKAKSTNKKRKR